jgi:hypothetical protein
MSASEKIILPGLLRAELEALATNLPRICLTATPPRLPQRACQVYTWEISKRLLAENAALKRAIAELRAEALLHGSAGRTH